VLPFCGDGAAAATLRGGEGGAGLGLGAVEIGLETGCNGTDGTTRSSWLHQQIQTHKINQAVTEKTEHV